MSCEGDVSTAQARLNRLFLRIGRPPVPDPNVPTLFETEMAQKGAGTETLPKLSSDQTGHHTSIAFATEPTTPVSTVGDTGAPQNPIDDDSIQDHAGKHIRFYPHGKISLAVKEEDSYQRTQTIQMIMGCAGTPKPLMSEFCLFALLVKFPYKYMDDPGSVVSRQFFAGNKFYARKWSLYYLNPPKSIGGKPLILIPREEAQNLLQEISVFFNIDLFVPPFPFVIPFYDDNTPQPSSLGVSRSRDDSNTMQRNIPYEVSGGGEIADNLSDDFRKDLMAWQNKFVQAQAATNQKASRKGTKQLHPQIHIATSNEQLHRSRNYLSLRPFRGEETCDRPAEISEDIVQQPKGDKSQVVLVCIDVEVDERNHGVITEIGVSTLDTIAIQKEPPGEEGGNWINCIYSRHFRIKGTERIRNSRWCNGNPDSFDYGDTEWIRLAEIDQTLDNCIHPQLHSQPQHGQPQSDNEVGPVISETGDDIQPDQTVELGPRNIVILGHDIRADINYLTSQGCKIFNAYLSNQSRNSSLGSNHDGTDITTARQAGPSTIIDILDTAVIDQAIHKSTQPRSLAKVCESLDITPWHLHNAGNDARYTLEAFIKLVLKSCDGDETQTQE